MKKIANRIALALMAMALIILIVEANEAIELMTLERLPQIVSAAGILAGSTFVATRTDKYDY